MVAAVNDYAFDVLGMPEMLLNNAEPNVGSHRLKEISGAVILGTRERDDVGGRFHEVLWLLRSEA